MLSVAIGSAAINNRAMKKGKMYLFNKVSRPFSLLLSNLLHLNSLRELSAKRQVSLHGKQTPALTSRVGSQTEITTECSKKAEPWF